MVMPQKKKCQFFASAMSVTLDMSGFRSRRFVRFVPGRRVWRRRFGWHGVLKRLGGFGMAVLKTPLAPIIFPGVGRPDTPE